MAGTAGNLVEWFDWSVYGFFAPYFAASFFPNGDEVAQLLKAFAVFAVGFFVRPIGGAILGSYADRHGRRAGMSLTILLMAAASLLMALTPSYHAIGVAAPLLLALGRSIQGFSAGGEFGTSSAFIVEHAEPGRRASAGAWQQVSVGAGTLMASLLAAGMFSNLTVQALSTWGWRLAFGLGALLGLLGLYLRLRVSDTEAFERVRDRGVSGRPLREMLLHHPGAALRVMAMVAAGTGLVQFWFVYYPTLAHLRTGAPLKYGQLAATAGLALFVVLLPLMGRLSDRLGRRLLLGFFAVGSAISFAPLLISLRPTRAAIMVPVLVSAVFLAAYAGSLAAVMAEQFPPRVRTAGISLPYGIAVAVFGGLTPVLATRLLQADQFGTFMVIMAALCVASAVVFVTMPETNRAEI